MMIAQLLENYTEDAVSKNIIARNFIFKATVYLHSTFICISTGKVFAAIFQKIMHFLFGRVVDIASDDNNFISIALLKPLAD